MYTSVLLLAIFGMHEALDEAMDRNFINLLEAYWAVWVKYFVNQLEMLKDWPEDEDDRKNTLLPRFRWTKKTLK